MIQTHLGLDIFWHYHVQCLGRFFIFCLEKQKMQIHFQSPLVPHTLDCLSHFYVWSFCKYGHSWAIWMLKFVVEASSPILIHWLDFDVWKCDHRIVGNLASNLFCTKNQSDRNGSSENLWCLVGIHLGGLLWLIYLQIDVLHIFASR